MARDCTVNLTVAARDPVDRNAGCFLEGVELVPIPPKKKLKDVKRVRLYIYISTDWVGKHLFGVETSRSSLDRKWTSL